MGFAQYFPVNPVLVSIGYWAILLLAVIPNTNTAWTSKIKSNQIKIYIAPYVHEDSEALGGWITCSRRVGIDKFLNVF